VPASIEEIEDFLCHLGTHRDDAPVIEDPETRGKHSFEEHIEGVLGASGSDLLRETLDARAEDSMPAMHGPHTESEREVRLAGSRFSEKESDLIFLDKGKSSEFFDSSSVDIRIEIPVERFKRCYLRELCSSDSSLDR
jgi:hypothetical protein